MSNRKPFNVNAGYVASKINPLTGIANVIYIASEAGIDADQKYVTVCEAHHQMVSSSSIPKARIDMKDASQWCSSCRFIVENTAGMSGFSKEEDSTEYLQDLNGYNAEVLRERVEEASQASDAQIEYEAEMAIERKVPRFFGDVLAQFDE